MFFNILNSNLVYDTAIKIVPNCLAGFQELLDSLRKFRCENCGRCYKHKFLLARHQRYECGKEPQFACHFCDYKASYKQRLRTHMAMRHKLPGQPLLDL